MEQQKRAWVAGTSPAMTMEGLPGWERASPTSARLEWDLVVEVFGEGTAGRGGDAGGRAGFAARVHRARAAEIFAAAVGADVIAGSIEEGQLTAEAVDDHLG